MNIFSFLSVWMCLMIRSLLHMDTTSVRPAWQYAGNTARSTDVHLSYRDLIWRLMLYLKRLYNCSRKTQKVNRKSSDATPTNESKWTLTWQSVVYSRFWSKNICVTYTIYVENIHSTLITCLKEVALCARVNVFVIMLWRKWSVYLFVRTLFEPCIQQ